MGPNQCCWGRNKWHVYFPNDSISTDHIKTNAIDSSKILAGSIVAEIATDAIEAINIKSGVITGDKLLLERLRLTNNHKTITGDLIKSDNY